MPKKTEIDDEVLIQLTKDHVSMHVIAKYFNCSESSIKRRKRKLDIYSFTHINKEELEEEIIKIKNKFTGDNWGMKMVKGNLKTIGINIGNHRINNALKMLIQLELKKKGKTVKRRQYNCPNGNQVIFFITSI